MLILGDSFAEGFSVSLEDTVSRALERELGTKGCAAEVVGGGTVGYSTDQEYLFYRDEGAAYGARVVVLLFYYNDILYNARGAVMAGVPKPPRRPSGCEAAPIGLARPRLACCWQVIRPPVV